VLPNNMEFLFYYQKKCNNYFLLNTES